MSASGEKRFDPTPTRRERAKREGNVARSSELAGSGAFAGALLGLVGVSAPLARAAAGSLRGSAAAEVALIALALVPAAGAAAGSVLLTLAQSGGLHVSAPKLALERLAPSAGVRRMFGAEAALAGARATLAFVVVGAALVPVSVQLVAHVSAAGAPAMVARAAADAIVALCATACVVGAIFAFGDFALVRRRWLRSLRMTLEELKRDLREQDGDPHAKSRRRQIHRSMARSGLGRVSQASLVVVNPTHLAIALRYLPPSVPVPEILVRATDEIALHVRALAERAGIPVIEDVALARLLFRVGEAGRPIPPETFVAVAQIIAVLLQSGALRA